jgi:hypothetical protein
VQNCAETVSPMCQMVDSNFGKAWGSARVSFIFVFFLCQSFLSCLLRE